MGSSLEGIFEKESVPCLVTIFSLRIRLFLGEDIFGSFIFDRVAFLLVTQAANSRACFMSSSSSCG